MQERAVETRRRVLISAAHIFAESGFDAATIADVLTHAGVTKGALYFHFSSKDELAAAVMEAQLNWLNERAVDEAAPMQFLVDLSYEFCRALQQDPVVRASIRLTVERATYLGSSEGLYGAWAQHSKRVFESAARAGQLAEGWRPSDLARLIVGCITGIQMASAAETGTKDLIARVQVFWRAVIPSLVPAETAATLRLSPPRASRRGAAG